MKTVGVTGHQNLPQQAVEYIYQELHRVLEELGDPLIGVSSLAGGADQLFARVILDHGGRLHVVVPSDDYEASFANAEASNAYSSLLARAENVERLAHARPSEDAYLEAGRRIVDLSDVVLAIWDGRPARGKGGTGDVVNYARGRGKRVMVIWPTGVDRD